MYIERERKTVPCNHCNGDGMCKHSKTKNEKAEDAVILFRECSRCGRGNSQKITGHVTATIYGLAILTSTDGLEPVCAVCGGKGFHVV